jgi:hypothetical protein
MTMKKLNSTKITRSSIWFVAISALTILSGCNTMNPAEGIGYRDARFQAISAMQDYRRCRDEALQLDEQARNTGSSSQYLISAQLLEKCEANLGPEAVEIATDERMRAYALSIQNYLKAGDLMRAQENLDRFNTAFPDNDLYYPNGSSFKDNMRALLGQVRASDYNRYSLLNANPALKSEMRRINYWHHK